MATLTDDEKTVVRQELARAFAPSWVKGAVNDASQAVETLLVNNAAAISNAIDSATAPYGITFTVAQKKLIVALTLFVKYLRDR